MNSRLTKYVIAGIAMIVFSAMIGFRPEYRDYRETSNLIKESQQKLAGFEEITLLLPEMVKTRQSLAKRIENLNSSLYTKENILNLFKSFDELATKNNVKIVEITPPIEELLRINRVAPDSALLMYLNISLRIEGNYRNFGQFVSDLEKEEFYRGPNHCNIVSTYDRRAAIQHHLGFRSLLGSLKEDV